MKGDHLGAPRTASGPGPGGPAGDRAGLVALGIGGLRCALPVESVLEVHPMVAVTPLPDGPEEVEGVVDAHGELVGVVDLRRWLRQPVAPPRAEDRLVLVETPRRRLALQVGADVDLVDAPVADLDEALRTDDARVLGAARLDDGLVLLVDLERFLAGAVGDRLDRAIEALVAGAGP